ncbi:hypothetical protein TNCV_4650751 [Trichonephila clavipes]|nr:hypothetical protein TNCV_4650751 [Trichonephila clavipes]
MISEPRECQENIPQTIMLPPPAWTVPAMVAGWFLSEVSRLIRQRPSVPWSIKRDSSENATFWETLLVAPWFSLVVSCSTVARLSARTHLRNRRSPLSSMARGAPHFCHVPDFEQSHFAMHGTLYHGGMRTVHKLSRFELLPPLARKPMIMPFGRRINRFVSALRQRLKCFPKPSHTLYIRSTALCCHLPSVIG